MNRDEQPRATASACLELLDHVLQGEQAWLNRLAPDGTSTEELAGLVDRGTPAHRDRPLRIRWLSFLGDVLWEVFSDNNDVVGPDGELYDLGSFRGSGDFLADYLNDRLAEDGGGNGWGPFDYMDFYMGTLGLFGDGDLSERGRPFYVHVFERLRAREGDWRYTPPALGLVRLKAKDEADDPARYDPGAALATGADQAEADAEIDEFARRLAEANAEAFERDVQNPPLIARAYRDVYGEWPRYVRR